MITSRKTEYVLAKKKGLNVKYIPDERYRSWYGTKRVSSRDLRMSIIMEKDDVSPVPPMLSSYRAFFYQESLMDDIKEIVINSDLVICQSYNVHIACIILEVPFISHQIDKEVAYLLKDIGIVRHRDIYDYINLWPKHSKLIRKYNEREISI